MCGVGLCVVTRERAVTFRTTVEAMAIQVFLLPLLLGQDQVSGVSSDVLVQHYSTSSCMTTHLASKRPGWVSPQVTGELVEAKKFALAYVALLIEGVCEILKPITLFLLHLRALITLLRGRSNIFHSRKLAFALVDMIFRDFFVVPAI